MENKEKSVIVSDLEEGEILDDDDDDIEWYEDITVVKSIQKVQGSIPSSGNLQWIANMTENHLYGNYENVNDHYQQETKVYQNRCENRNRQNLVKYNEGHNVSSIRDDKDNTDDRMSYLNKNKHWSSNYVKNFINESKNKLINESKEVKRQKVSPYKTVSHSENTLSLTECLLSSVDDLNHKQSTSFRKRKSHERMERNKSHTKDKRQRDADKKKPDCYIDFFHEIRKDALRLKNLQKECENNKKNEYASHNENKSIERENESFPTIKAIPGSLGEMLLKNQIKAKLKEDDASYSVSHHISEKIKMIEVTPQIDMFLSDSKPIEIDIVSSNRDFSDLKDNVTDTNENTQNLNVLEEVNSCKFDFSNESEESLRTQALQSALDIMHKSNSISSASMKNSKDSGTTVLQASDLCKVLNELNENNSSSSHDAINILPTRTMCDDMEISEEDTSNVTPPAPDSKLDHLPDPICTFSASEIEHPLQGKWAYMIPPLAAAKSTNPSDDQNSVNDLYCNERIIDDATSGPSQPFEIQDRIESCSYQSSKTNSSESIASKVDCQATEHQTNIGDGSHSKQFRSVMTSGLNHIPSIEHSFNPNKTTKTVSKQHSRRILTVVPIESNKPVKATSPKKRRRKRSNKGNKNGTLNSMKEEEDEDILRAQLLNQMTLKPSNSVPTSSRRNDPASKSSISKNIKSKKLEFKTGMSRKKLTRRIEGGKQENKAPYTEATHGKREFSMQNFPKVKPVIINLDTDSDSSDYDDNTSKSISISTQSIDSLLKSLRNSNQESVGDLNSTAKATNIAYQSSSKVVISPAPQVVQLMSSDKQQEYFKLRKRKMLLLKKRQKSSFAKAPKYDSKIGDFVSTSTVQHWDCNSDNSHNQLVNQKSSELIIIDNSEPDDIASIADVNVSEDSSDHAQSSLVIPKTAIFINNGEDISPSHSNHDSEVENFASDTQNLDLPHKNAESYFCEKNEGSDLIENEETIAKLLPISQGTDHNSVIQLSDNDHETNDMNCINESKKGLENDVPNCSLQPNLSEDNTNFDDDDDSSSSISSSDDSSSSSDESSTTDEDISETLLRKKLVDAFNQRKGNVTPQDSLSCDVEVDLLDEVDKDTPSCMVDFIIDVEGTKNETTEEEKLSQLNPLSSPIKRYFKNIDPKLSSDTLPVDNNEEILFHSIVIETSRNSTDPSQSKSSDEMEKIEHDVSEKKSFSSSEVDNYFRNDALNLSNVLLSDKSAIKTILDSSNGDIKIIEDVEKSINLTTCLVTDVEGIKGQSEFDQTQNDNSVPGKEINKKIAPLPIVSNLHRKMSPGIKNSNNSNMTKTSVAPNRKVLSTTPSRLSLLRNIKEEYAKKFVDKNTIKNKIVNLLKETTQMSAMRQSDLRKISEVTQQLKKLRFQEKSKVLQLTMNITSLSDHLESLDKSNEALAKLENLKAQVYDDRISKANKDLTTSKNFKEKNKLVSQISFLKRSLKPTYSSSLHQDESPSVLPMKRSLKYDSNEGKKCFKVDNRMMSKQTNLFNDSRPKKSDLDRIVDPADLEILCPYDLLGKCNDDQCQYRHTTSNVNSKSEKKESKENTTNSSSSSKECVAVDFYIDTSPSTIDIPLIDGERAVKKSLDFDSDETDKISVSNAEETFIDEEKCDVRNSESTTENSSADSIADEAKKSENVNLISKLNLKDVKVILTKVVIPNSLSIVPKEELITPETSIEMESLPSPISSLRAKKSSRKLTSAAAPAKSSRKLSVGTPENATKRKIRKRSVVSPRKLSSLLTKKRTSSRLHSKQ